MSKTPIDCRIEVRMLHLPHTGKAHPLKELLRLTMARRPDSIFPSHLEDILRVIDG